ncbi:DUF2076 domain-containing protein [Rhizobium herbae]|nr:DUF2076 family protein [Rhizobium herbae]
MSPDEQKLLEELFERTRAAQDTQRDPQAETLINEAIRAQPHAPYLLSQAVILQDQALRSAAGRLKELEQRITELESRSEQPQKSGGSFLGGLGGLFGSQPPQSSQPAYAQQSAPSGPWGNEQRPTAGPWGAAAPSPAGGFLRGAMGTAAGVAGGMLLANSLTGLFGGGHGLFGGTGGLTGPQEVIEENVVNNNYFGSGDTTPDIANSAGNDNSLTNADFSDDSPDFSDDSFDV